MVKIGSRNPLLEGLKKGSFKKKVKNEKVVKTQSVFF